MKKILIGAGLILLVSALVAYKVYHKPHRQIEDERAIVLTATELFNEFENHELEAYAKYLDKVMQVTGEISEVRKNQEGKTIFLLKKTHRFVINNNNNTYYTYN